MPAHPRGPSLAGTGLELPSPLARLRRETSALLDRLAPTAFLGPAVLIVLLFSLFPLVLSLYISLVQLQFVPGGFHLSVVGLRNYLTLLVGSDRQEFLGALARPSPAGWAVLAGELALLLLWLGARRWLGSVPAASWGGVPSPCCSGRPAGSSSTPWPREAGPGRSSSPSSTWGPG